MLLYPAALLVVAPTRVRQGGRDASFVGKLNSVGVASSGGSRDSGSRSGGGTPPVDALPGCRKTQQQAVTDAHGQA